MTLVRIPESLENAAEFLSTLPPGRRWHADPGHRSFGPLETAALIPEKVGARDVILVPEEPITRLRTIVLLLLSPHGCPWDREQTHATLRASLLEEAHEAAAAIDDADDAALREELGDVLLQPILHAAIAERRGAFDLVAVAEGIADKLERRHPHVFGQSSAATSDEVLRQWDAIKRDERSRPKGVLDGVPRAAPALNRALAISKRAARAGFEWPNLEGVFNKLREETDELRAAITEGDREEIEGEVGDLLFTVVNLARWNGVDPEAALSRMLDRFSARFSRMEREDTTPLADLDPDAWDARWRRAKAAEA